MKTRHLPQRGYVDPKSLPTGPSGLPLCRHCLTTEVKRPRKTFCSDDCIHEWKVRTQSGYAAKWVLVRDCGVCSACGLDCVQLLQSLKVLRSQERLRILGQKVTHHCLILSGDATLPRLNERLDELGLVGGRRLLSKRLWDVDHIIPVSEGGGGCGLANLRTLCWRCHQNETTALAGRRALSRRSRTA